MTAPSHKGRSAEQIISEHIYHDAPGFSYRAASWLDLARRTDHFAALHYACIDARLAIEHLIFEQLAISAGADLDADAYQQCLAEPRKLDKLLNKIVPHYERLQAFTEIVQSLSPEIPPVNQWDIKELRKRWGRLSRYLHWMGAHPETTENPTWQAEAIQNAADIVDNLWEKISTGHSGSIRLDSMPSHVHEIWERFKAGEIDRESARTRLELVRPLTKRRHV